MQLQSLEKTPSVRMEAPCLHTCLVLVCFLLFYCASPVMAEPQLMTDADLDAVSGRGVTDEEGNAPTNPVLDLNGLLASANADGSGALFSIDTASLLGSGSIDLAGLTQGGGITLNGQLSPAVLNVEQLSFIVNLNLCVNCTAGNSIELNNFAIPITFAAPKAPSGTTP